MFSFNTVNYFNKYTIYFSYPKSWVMWAIIDLHDYLMFFIINIFLVVVIYMFLILVIQQNFFQKSEIIAVYTILKVKDYNDEPLLEFFWTILPALLLTVMSWPSFTLLYAMEQLIDPFHTVIITGNQWYWTYQYSDFDVVSDIIIQLDSIKGFDYFSKIIKKELNLFVVYDQIKYSLPYCNYSDFLKDQAVVPILINKIFGLNSIIPQGVKFGFAAHPVDFNIFCSDEFRKALNKFYPAKNFFFSWPNDLIFEDFKRDFKNSLTIKNCFNYWDLIQFIGKHARKYESTQLVYDAMIITDDNLPIGYPRLLCTDQVLILPANVSIRLLITSNDVIHSWALPSHGIKMDAIPGRINQVPFLTPFWGTYWGQCSELCGINHGFMPIEVRVVCLEDYLSFIKLNISYKYDKFCPLIRNLIASYVCNLGEENLKNN